MSAQTIFLAWQDKAQTKRWFPIGRLDMSHDGFCTFKYIQGVKDAIYEVGFKPLPAFPDFTKEYCSDELFPMFQNRVMNRNRGDFAGYLNQMDLSGDPNPLEILSVDGGQRETDHFEVFPLLLCDGGGHFSCRFFLHGWRYIAKYSQKRLASIQAGDPLLVTLELTNLKTKLGLQIQTMDYCMIGWAPCYLANDLNKAMLHENEKPEDIETKVIKVNHDAPMHQRYLIEFKGRFKKYRPMQSEEFKVLSK